ncbi:MAG: alpha/beta fold hydrolase [Acidimicrobiales bacterium]
MAGNGGGVATRLAGWRSEAGRDAYCRAYDDARRLWPVHHESQLIETRFGSTHALMCGPTSGAPLLLLPAAIGIGALQWFPTVEGLAPGRRIVAVDFVGAPGKGRSSTPMLDRADCGRWVVDLLDALSSEPVDVIGSSQGGWLALSAAVQAPERIGRLALLAPAASFLPMRLGVRLMLRLGPHLPAATAGPSLQASFGRRYWPDRQLVKVTTLGLKHFRYQQDAVQPDVFSDAELGRVRSRTLVMVGDREMIYPPQAMLDRATATVETVETDLVPAAGHLLNIDGAEHVNAELQRFFSTVETVPEGRPNVEAGTGPRSNPDRVRPVGPDHARPRAITVERFPPMRRVTVAALRAGRGRVPIHGLVDLDVTEARQLLSEADEDLSLTAFIVACVARAAATNPRIHAYRDWRGRVVSHDHVDVTTMVEIATPGGPWPLALMLANADRRSVADLSSEVRRVQTKPNSDRSSRWLQRGVASLGRVPGLLRLAYWVGDRTEVGRRRTGTVAVSAVGMLGDGGGHAIAAPTLYTLAVAVGGITVQPRIVDGRVVDRQLLNVTITADHRLVDGGPAARFATELRHLVETAAVLREAATIRS